MGMKLGLLPGWRNRVECDGVLRKIFESKNEKENGENYIMRTFVI